MKTTLLNKGAIQELAWELRERVSLSARPIGLSMIQDEAEIPVSAKRPSQKEMEWSVCMAANQVRNMGWTVAFTVKDHFCLFAAAGLGHLELPPYLQDGKMGSHHTRTEKLGIDIQKKFQDKHFFKPKSTTGIMLTPATDPAFVPQGLVIYGNPTQIGKIAKAITWYTGKTVPVSAGGFGGCIVAAASVRDANCQIVLPCSGEKIWGHTEENEIFLACPISVLPIIVKGLKKTDVILPYPTSKYMIFNPTITKSYPIDMGSYREYVKNESDLNPEN